MENELLQKVYNTVTCNESREMNFERFKQAVKDLNYHYQAAKPNTGEQCFIDTDKLYELGAVLTDKAVDYLNARAEQYVIQRLGKGVKSSYKNITSEAECFTNDDMHDFVGSYQRSDEDVWSIVDRMNLMAQQYADHQNRQLLAWKESAMKILSSVNDQEIGKLLGVPIGHSISENLLEKIREYGDQRAKKALDVIRYKDD